MCCFSQPVLSVSNTNIFARMGEGIDQFVIYAMSLSARTDLAMVLPIPVAKGSGEKAVKFYNLEKYPSLFQDMAKGFPRLDHIYYSSGPFSAEPAGRSQTLEVVGVGSFEASFVPSVADFVRLDKRFRLADDVWKKLPGYAEFGFAVFKLRAGNSPVHPMAFSFPSAIPQTLFFPTVHIHDGEVHEKAEFDHTLYCQATGLNHRDWEESPSLAVTFLKCGLAHNIVQAGHHVHRRVLHGMLANGDVVVRASKLPA